MRLKCMKYNFADRLLDAIDRKRNPSVIGLDTDVSRVPPHLVKEARARRGDGHEAAAESMLGFNKAVIDAIRDIVPAVKLQSAFYERHGPSGQEAFLRTAEHAKSRGLVVIGDVKRGDIGSTSAAYADAYLGPFELFGRMQEAYGLDAVTVNPYMGSDGVKPFIESAAGSGRGVFVLVRTSNPSASEIQDLVSGKRKVYEAVAGLVDGWGSGLVGERGYSPVGAVVGATCPKEAEILRRRMPRAIFLVPGYGAQGGTAADIAPCFAKDGRGALVHSARAVIFAYEKSVKPEDFTEAARTAAIRMRDDICASLKAAGKLPW